MDHVVGQLYGRQGDVGFVSCRIPAGARRIDVRPFALGEVTGHSHRVADADVDGLEMYEMNDRTFIRVTKDGGISIVHEDHDPHGRVSKLPGGFEGEVPIAGEYTPEGIRPVVD